jgi:hypothetical protein
MVLKKLSEGNSTILTEKPALVMVTSVPFSKLVILESKESKCCGSRPETFNLITVVSDITNGLAFKLWGAIGVNTID